VNARNKTSKNDPLTTTLHKRAIQRMATVPCSVGS
jgi:hypothetical protein